MCLSRTTIPRAVPVACTCTLILMELSYATSWIQGNTVLAATNVGKRLDNSIGFGDYPKGHEPYKVLSRFVNHGHDYVYDIVVSVPPGSTRTRH